MISLFVSFIDSSRSSRFAITSPTVIPHASATAISTSVGRCAITAVPNATPYSCSLIPGSSPVTTWITAFTQPICRQSASPTSVSAASISSADSLLFRADAIIMTFQIFSVASTIRFGFAGLILNSAPSLSYGSPCSGGSTGFRLAQSASLFATPFLYTILKS